MLKEPQDEVDAKLSRSLVGADLVALAAVAVALGAALIWWLRA